ncbi:MAG: Protein-glutamine gamma-glutamyltransferase [Anaerolineales bacterium]|nr:Protein-glutamine gamma-glutamyltransferase [Anaerolineales bacterium]
MSLILLTLMLLTVAWSIEAAKWAEGLALLQGAVLVGIVVGFAFAVLPIPGLVAHTISTIAGIGWSAMLVGRLLDPTSVTHMVVLDEQALTWQVRLTEVVYRTQKFVEIARAEGVGSDNLVFILQLAILMWLVSYASIWFLFELRSVWGAIVPSGFAILLNLYYASPDLYVWMAMYLLCALLLIIRSNVFLQQWEWRRAGVSYSPEISYDFLWHGAVFATLVILLAWIVPTTSAAPRLHTIVGYLDEPIYRFQREFNRLYSSLNYRPQPGPAYFADTMTLSGAVNLGDAPIFDAVTEKGRYWRSIVYDQYTGRGWVNTATSLTTLADDDERLTALEFELRQPVTQTIRVLQPKTTQLYTLPQPIDVDLPSRAQYSPIQNTNAEIQALNVSMLESQRPLVTGETYTAISSLSVADTKNLRQAGTDYPDWIKDKYLQLPDDLPKRVRELAVEIAIDKTATDKDNAYDQVTAIQSYLRNIRYDEEIPAPPPNVDSVDWFLFDQRAGYCDYYASSLVVMARSLGIPARVAAGYSLGEYDSEIEAYRHYEYDAHSWPEVFFPKYGWVEFEPTAADPEIVRPVVSSSESEESFSGDTGDGRTPGRPDEEMLMEDRYGDEPFLSGLQQRGPALWVWGLGVLGVLVVAAAAAWFLWRRPYQDLSLAGATYARMVRLASWLGLPAEPSQTPNEYADQLADVVPEGRPAVGEIVNAYVLELFAEVSPGEEEASALHDAWLSLRRTLVERIGVRVLHRITGNPAGPNPTEGVTTSQSNQT